MSAYGLLVTGYSGYTTTYCVIVDTEGSTREAVEEAEESEIDKVSVETVYKENRKTMMKTLVLFSLLHTCLCFEYPSEDSVCNSNQQCKLPKDCPQVVKDFKEKKIKPTICK